MTSIDRAEVQHATAGLPEGDLNEKIGIVLRNSCGGRHGAVLVQYWTATTTEDGQLVLKTRISHSFLVTPNEALFHYWETSCCNEMRLPVPPPVSLSDFDWHGSVLGNLCSLVYQASNCVGMLQLVSDNKETCVQFFKDGGFCDQFQKEGLICSDILDEISHIQVLNDKDLFVTWTRDVYKKKGVVLVIRSSNPDRIYFRCEMHGQTSTKKTKSNCPFQIMGFKSKENGIWSLRVIQGFHNHATGTF
ncbi:unnamed protein product [Camellia sinensis]